MHPVGPYSLVVSIATLTQSWGSAPDPLGELTALPRPLAGFEGPTSKGGKGKGRDERGGREERGGLSGNVAEEAFCPKSTPGFRTFTYAI